MLPKDGKMHFSNLKNFAKSPAHYAMSCDMERKDTEVFRIGRAVHGDVLENKKPIFYPNVRRGKEWDSFVASCGAPESEILSVKEAECAYNCAASIIGNKYAKELLARCPNREQKIDWTRDGIECSGRIDACGETDIVEIKTTNNVFPRKFLFDANRLGYHAQLAWYDVALGTDPRSQLWRNHWIIAAETNPPYPVLVFQLDPLRSDQGNQLIETWLAKFRECTSTGFFPSYEFEQPYIWDGELIFNQEDEDDDHP